MKIKNQVLLWGSVNFITVKMFLFTPSYLIGIGKQASWIMVVINTLITALFFYFAYKLYKKNDEKEFLSEKTFINKVLSLGLFAYFIIMASITLKLLIKGVIREFMPDSPELFISAFFVVVILYTSRQGLVSNLSLAMLTAPILGFILIVSVVMLPYYDFNNIFPILGGNNFFDESFYIFSFFSDFIIFIMLMPYLEKKENILKNGMSVIFISGTICLLTVLLVTLSIPKEARLFSPFYYIVSFLAGSRSAFNFVKISGLIFLINFLSYFSLSITLASKSLSLGFSLKYKEALAPALVALFVLAGEISEKFFDITTLYSFFAKYSFVIFPLIPLISMIKLKKGREKG